MIVYALLVILIVLFLPKGIYGSLAARFTAMSLLEVRDLAKSFAGLRAVRRRVADRRGGQHPRHHRPERGRQDDAVQSVIAGAIPPTPAGCTSTARTSPGARRTGCPLRAGPHLPADAAVREMTVLENVAVAAHGRTGAAAPPGRRRRASSSGCGLEPVARPPGRRTAHRGPQAAGAGPRAGRCDPAYCCSTRCSPGWCPRNGRR